MSDEPEQYKVKIEGPGLSVERAVDGPTALRLAGLAFGGEAQAVARDHEGAESVGKEPPTRQQRPQSVGEYLSASGASSNVAKIVAFAAYLNEAEKVETFSRDQVRQLFERARQQPPKNFSRDFNVAVASNWIAESSQSGQFFVTGSGEEAVRGKFADAPKSRRPRKGSKSTAKKAASSSS